MMRSIFLVSPAKLANIEYFRIPLSFMWDILIFYKTFDIYSYLGVIIIIVTLTTIL